jgi:hypothetical protein
LDEAIGVRVAKPTDLLDTKLYLQNFVVRWTSLLSALEGSPHLKQNADWMNQLA